MRTLKFRVAGQKIDKDPACDFSGLVPGTSGYLRAEFQFDEEWNGCRKAAVFTKFSQDYPVPIINGSCEIPAETLSWKSWEVRVVGERDGYRITTGKIQIRQEG